ncbi:MAG: hypothetical protein ACLTER_12790 [Ruminococcus sp.]
MEDTAEIQKVEMKDAVPKGLLLINKEGEFLEDVSRSGFYRRMDRPLLLEYVSVVPEGRHL